MNYKNIIKNTILAASTTSVITWCVAINPNIDNNVDVDKVKKSDVIHKKKLNDELCYLKWKAWDYVATLQVDGVDKWEKCDRLNYATRLNYNIDYKNKRDEKNIAMLYAKKSIWNINITTEQAKRIKSDTNLDEVYNPTLEHSNNRNNTDTLKEKNIQDSYVRVIDIASKYRDVINKMISNFNIVDVLKPEDIRGETIEVKWSWNKRLK